MADTLRDINLTQAEDMKEIRPLENDLTAYFTIMRDELVKVLSGNRKESPNEVIKALDSVVSGEQSRKQAVSKSIMNIQGIAVNVDYGIGDMRSGYDSQGEFWQTNFKVPYGRIQWAGDQGLDVFIGDYINTPTVFIIHQKDPILGTYDEDKIMLGYQTAEQAKRSYLDHHGQQKNYIGMTEIPIDEFKEILEIKAKEYGSVKKSIVVQLYKRGYMGGEYANSKAKSRRITK